MTDRLVAPAVGSSRRSSSFVTRTMHFDFSVEPGMGTIKRDDTPPGIDSERIRIQGKSPRMTLWDSGYTLRTFETLYGSGDRCEPDTRNVLQIRPPHLKSDVPGPKGGSAGSRLREHTKLPMIDY